MEKAIVRGKEIFSFKNNLNLQEILKQFTSEHDSLELDSPLMLYHLDIIFSQFNRWTRELPMIQAFYAVKCNPDPVLLEVFSSLGIGFDCASQSEISTILQLGVSSDRIVYANTCKSPSSLKFSDNKKVHLMIADGLDELKKIAAFHPQAEILIRMNVLDKESGKLLSRKFGADSLNLAPRLLKFAKGLQLNVVGVCFHVGVSSGCGDPRLYRYALEQAQNLFEIGHKLGFQMKILDIGGGFPAGGSFESYAKIIRDSIEEFFPQKEIRFIAEPGRFFASLAVTLAVKIISAYDVSASEVTGNEEDVYKPGRMYYINDSLYGSFICKAFSHFSPIGEPIQVEPGAEQYSSTIWGPTCNGADLIEDNKMMSYLHLGDWLKYPQMGAYTSTAASTFNGFPHPKNVYVIGEENLGILLKTK